MNSPSSSTTSKLPRLRRSLSRIFRRPSATSERDHLAKLQELRELRTRLGSITEVRPRVNPCMEGTRTNILSDVKSKIDNFEDKNIIWIYGAPGSGKSAVSLTIKLSLRKQGQLLTYFRFDRNDSAVTTSTGFWRRVAYDLADQYSSVRTDILSQLRSNKVDLTSTMDMFSSLIEEPLSKLTDPPPDRPWVIVIDGLDECGGFESRSSSERKALLKTLRRWPHLPKYLKLIITSREEGDISRVLKPISALVEIHSGRFLTENPQAKASVDASTDIRTFLEEGMREITAYLASLPHDWPGKDVVSGMVSRAAGNFMWATTALKFIESGLDPQEQLEKVMGVVPQSMDGMALLYSLYSTILKTSLGDLGVDRSDAERLRAVFGTIVFARGPLYDNDYTKLPIQKPVNANVMAVVRDRLRSVIDQGPAVRFVHKSFDEFLLSDECPPEFAIRIDTSQRLLTKLCLTTMQTELRFNICDLETSCLKNADMPDIDMKVPERVSNLLSYSCCFWADHLRDTPFNTQIMGGVKVMIFDKLLFWFEVMSLLKEINRVPSSLLSVRNWANFASDGEFKDFIKDARHFVRAFIYPIAESAPHIYISALPFAPEHSLVAQRFLPQCPQVLKVSVGRPIDWSPCIYTSEHHKDWVRCVAFSQDEKYFVSGSGDCTICICDSETGNLVSGPFRAPHRIISSSFDPIGRRVWASCNDGQVISWDVETGDKHVGFHAGKDPEEFGDVIGCYCSNGGRNVVSVSQRKGAVTLWNADTGEQLNDVLKLPSGDAGTMVSFSPDGCNMAWAAWHDTTIRIYNLADGSQIPSSQRHVGHTERISTLSFSVDGGFVVSGSQDGTILVWNAKTGDIFGRLLDTNDDRVFAVAYCHESRTLVSASGHSGTMMVWNTSIEIAVPLKGHTNHVWEIALSQDGRRALSAAADGTVRMWDLDRVDTVSMSMEGRANPVDWVAFSPCGKRVASRESRGVQLWDAGTGEPLLNPNNTSSSSSPFLGTAFSPDGGKIIVFECLQNYYAIQAWSTNTGDLLFNCNLDCKGAESVKHINFRSTDNRLVTCSIKGVVRLWILEDNSLTEDISASSPKSEGPTKPVWIAALSPDGLTAIVSDRKRTPSHYIWSTTTSQVLPLTFLPDDEHVPRYRMAYSPSGKFFAAACKGGTLHIWNTQSGELIAALDGWLGSLAFSPDDAQIAFSCASPEDHRTTIQIMNSFTGMVASGPWKAHTDPITALAFSPDGNRLVSGSQGGQIGIWNTADLLGESKVSSGFLGVGTRMQDGWVVDTSGNLLFWVPKEHRSALVWSQNVTMIGGSGIQTDLDLTRFRYRENWMECFEGRT